MQGILFAVLMVICGIIFWQDVRWRSVHWAAFPMLFFVGVCYRRDAFSLLNWMYNSAFILFLMLVLTLYLSLKTGKFVRVYQGYFSWGDILFLVALIPLFDPLVYVAFFTFGTLAVLLLHVLAQLIRPQLTVPFAGYLGLVTMITLLFELPQTLLPLLSLS